MSHCRTQREPEYTWRCTHLCPWWCSRICPCRSWCLSTNLLSQGWLQEHKAQGPLLTAPTHTAVPRENPGWLTSALLEGFGVFHQTSREARQRRAASFLARSSNVYSTRQRSYRAESSHEKLMPYSSSLGRTVGLVGRRLQRLGLGFFFSSSSKPSEQPASARDCFWEASES